MYDLWKQFFESGPFEVDLIEWLYVKCASTARIVQFDPREMYISKDSSWINIIDIQISQMLLLKTFQTYIFDPLPTPALQNRDLIRITKSVLLKIA